MLLGEASRVRHHWILEASNIRPSLDRGQRCSKHLILLMFLAPRPGLEPGTYGLTDDRSIYPQTGMKCCAFRVVESNISCLLRASRARGRHPLKHWILEASGGSLHTRERASRCHR